MEGFSKKDKNRMDKALIVEWMTIKMKDESFADLIRGIISVGIKESRVGSMGNLKDIARSDGRKDVADAMRLFDNSMQWLDIMGKFKDHKYLSNS